MSEVVQPGTLGTPLGVKVASGKHATKGGVGGVGFEALPGSTHEKRPGRAAPAVCAQLLGGAQVDGHQTLAVELSPNAEDEPRTVEILDVETERLATSKARDIEQADQDVCGVSQIDRKSTRLNSSHLGISYAVFCLKKKKNTRA